MTLDFPESSAVYNGSTPFGPTLVAKSDLYNAARHVLVRVESATEGSKLRLWGRPATTFEPGERDAIANCLR